MKQVVILILGLTYLSKAYINPGRAGFFLKILISVLAGVFIIYRRMRENIRLRTAQSESDDEEAKSGG